MVYNKSKESSRLSPETQKSCNPKTQKLIGRVSQLEPEVPHEAVWGLNKNTKPKCKTKCKQSVWKRTVKVHETPFSDGFGAVHPEVFNTLSFWPRAFSSHRYQSSTPVEGRFASPVHVEGSTTPHSPWNSRSFGAPSVPAHLNEAPKDSTTSAPARGA